MKKSNRVIPVHRTETSTGEWDRTTAEVRLGYEEESVRTACAWGDGESDRFLHHEVAANGVVAAANLKACRRGIAILNGAHGGTTIPEPDRLGVYRHLAAHLQDAGADPLELKSGKAMSCERRYFALDKLRIERREDGPPRIIGHAAVFNILSEEMWGFREKVAPGAFKKTIQEADVRALFNHDPNFVLGRNKANTLELREDETGLAVDIDPPENGWAKDLLVSMERKDITQMSFAFQVIRQSWVEDVDEETLTRTLEEVRLFDVSVVTYPAYPQTDAVVREIPESEIDFPALARATVKAEKGLDNTSSDRELFTSAAEHFRSLAEPGQEVAHPTEQAKEPGDGKGDVTLPKEEPCDGPDPATLSRQAEAQEALLRLQI